VPSARLALLLLAAACFDPQYGDTTACGPARECPPGRTCVGDRCLVEAGPDAPGPILDARPPDAFTNGQIHISVTKIGARAGDGTLTVILPPPIVTCLSDCPGLELDVDPGTFLSIGAVPAAGAFFEGFDGPCSGPSRSCLFTANAAASLNARFETIDRNLVFVTSQALPATNVGLAGADQFCRDRASQAHISGNFVAVLGGGSTSAVTRLGTTRGFIRLDGLPVADTVDDLFVDHRLWYPILFDEFGNPVKGYAWTGSDNFGNPAGLDADCMSWTGVGTGVAVHTAGSLTVPFTFDCMQPHPLVCAMVNKPAPVTQPPVSAGKLIFVTHHTWFPSAGLDAAQEICTEEQAPGHVSKPLLATAATPASALLVPDQLYVRPDGIPIGAGAELVTGRPRSGIWVHADGAYFVGDLIWTGSDDVTHRAASTNCDEWSNPNLVGNAALAVGGSADWWFALTEACSIAHAIYCVEQ
jgi:hypothetical protein